MRLLLMLLMVAALGCDPVPCTVYGHLDHVAHATTRVDVDESIQYSCSAIRDGFSLRIGGSHVSILSFSVAPCTGLGPCETAAAASMDSVAGWGSVSVPWSPQQIDISEGNAGRLISIEPNINGDSGGFRGQLDLYIMGDPL